MRKKIVLFGLIFFLLFNLFSAPLSMLIYAVNKQVQTYGVSQYQEISLTICETSCSIQERITIEQHFPAQSQNPLRVSFSPLAVFFHTIDIEMPSPLTPVPNKLRPINIGRPEHVISAVFVPPQFG